MKFNPTQIDYANRALSRINWLIIRKVPFELSEIKPKRTNLQNRYMHLALQQVAMETGEDMEKIKQVLFKQICNKELFVIECPEGIYLRSTKDLDTKEMTVAIDRFRNYCSAELGIYIPDPNDARNMIAWEAELDKYNHK